MAYPIKFREHVLEIQRKEGLSIRKLSKRVQVGTTTVMRWIKRIEPLTKREKPSVKINLEELKKDVRKYPDAYQRERARRFGVSKFGIYWALKKLGVTYKKNLSAPES
jgi:transposase